MFNSLFQQQKKKKTQTKKCILTVKNDVIFWEASNCSHVVVPLIIHKEVLNIFHEDRWRIIKSRP